MQCLSCKEEVSAKFLHAISLNSCPFCGEHILPVELQASLNALREVMTDISVKNFLPDAFDWLRSNFDLISLNGAEYMATQDALTETQAGLTMAKDEITQMKREIDELKNRNLPPTPRSGKGMAPPGIQMGVDKDGQPIQLQGDPALNQTQTNAFLQRSGAHKSVANLAKIKELSEKLKSSSGQEDNNLMAMAMNSPEGETEYDPFLPADPYDGEDVLPPIAEQFAAMGANSATYNPKDVQSLQNQQAKVANAARELAYGGSAGVIARSS